MPELVRLVEWELSGLLLALTAIVAVQLLTGQINTRGLLYGRVGDGSNRRKQLAFSPARVQLLVSTLGAALYYLSLVLANPGSGQLPAVPRSWPAVLGGSHAIFLGGKAYARWFGGRKQRNA